MENYKEIKITGLGTSLNIAMKELEPYKERNEEVYFVFNGVKIYTYDDIESAYKKVTGMKKTEFDEKEDRKMAAQFLLADYLYDTELTDFTISDTEDIYEY